MLWLHHMNQYYFNDELNIKDITEKSVDFIVITHPDQDHTIGIKKSFREFQRKKDLYESARGNT